jgi:hypothetical protein|tara:strand:+ start:286 stop:486 length:201 start_codon:yes stop_codon:yes gene_type:complete
MHMRAASAHIITTILLMQTLTRPKPNKRVCIARVLLPKLCHFLRGFSPKTPLFKALFATNDEDLDV